MNTDNRFTSGEWMTDGKEVYNYLTTVCSLTNTSPYITADQAKANALLIASAPDMYAALVQCREWFEKHGKDYEIGTPNCFIKAKAAINKATNQLK